MVTFAGGIPDGGLVLESVGTTSFAVYSPDDPRVDRRQEYEPQLQAEVTNTSFEEREAAVIWTFDDTHVQSQTETIEAGQTATISNRVSWEMLQENFDLIPGDYALGVQLLGGPSWDKQTTTYGTMHVHEKRVPDSGDEPNDEPTYPPISDGDPPDGSSDPPPENTGPESPPALLPDGFPTLPAVGPLTAPQTTLAALAVVAVVVLR
ncbi:hypothetical protein BVU17_02385 [Haloarcula taiwanensis]|uniref:Uncharacterized protein n=1 Tax=Haloarcula taiwanensis TaxID=1932004 RepID=A0A2H4ZVB3_9EURY|nr:hypothetical protein [Haloarcula taiwanensis]AUG46424.1 hypothetical protein BVU17_02385 [Haloarcula taiwanensis]